MASPATAELPGTLGMALEAAASDAADRVFLRFGDMSLTFGAFNQRCNQVCHGLAELGVRPGEPVAVMLPNGPEFALSWFALAKLGAVTAAGNTEFRGAGLAAMLNVTGAEVVLVDDRYLPALAAVAGDLDRVRTVVVNGNVEAAAELPAAWEVRSYEALYSSTTTNPASPARWPDLLMLLFTSGTTGRSKACMISHRHALFQGRLFAHHMGLRSDDVFYCPFPLFHADATLYTVVPAILLRTTACIAERFSVSRFWSDVRRYGATTFDFMGATLTLLHKQPQHDDDADNPARLGWGIPLPDFAADFEKRFGVMLLDGYGMTESGVVIFHPGEGSGRSSPPGSSGRAVPPYDVRIVDDDDVELPPGSVGEIVVRADRPSVMIDGYYGATAETIDMFRNCWLHTGDLGSFDENGYLYFQGRQKDTIRRRGENIAAFEIEDVVDQHPLVLESAAVGVASELSEQDVKVFVVLRLGASLDHRELHAYCAERLARFMVPRYIEYVPELPKTPTEKVEKHALASAGVTPATWDALRGES